MQKRIELIAKEFLEKIRERDCPEIQILSHLDTDGITSAAIMIKTLKKLDKKFSVKIVKNLEEYMIHNLPKNKITLLLDLGSGSFNHIKQAGLKDIFIIDHHEIPQGLQPVSQEIRIINPELHTPDKQKISGSGLTYLFCREIYPGSASKEFLKLAVLGMIGDMLEKNIDKISNQILNQDEIIRKRGLLLYPSTRPLNKVLEFCSNPYIPGVTGNAKGVNDFLREINIKPENGKHKSLMELNKDEMSKLLTAILLKRPKTNHAGESMIGDIFLIKLFNKLEDARELSAMINACSRLGESEIAIQLCLEIPGARKKAETLYGKYKRFLVSSLDYILKAEKIQGKQYIIINAKEQIRDTIIGTVASILSNSLLYDQGTIIIAMAYNTKESKIKVSSRSVGENSRNVREILSSVVSKIGGEVGGHRFAAGCIIKQEKEKEFIEELKKNLEIEIVKV